MTVEFFIQTFVRNIAQKYRNNTSVDNQSITKQSTGFRSASWNDNFDSKFTLYYRFISL